MEEFLKLRVDERKKLAGECIEQATARIPVIIRVAKNSKLKLQKYK